LVECGLVQAIYCSGFDRNDDFMVKKESLKQYILVLFLLSGTAFSQSTDTLKVVTYNLLNFPGSSPNRVDTLEVIMQHLKPDILTVCELTSSAGATDILEDALNVDGTTSYEMAYYVDSPGSQNELYYNSEKLVLVEQNEIATVLRDINEYVLYHKADDLETTGDTVFFYVYVCHLKAGTGFEAQRDSETNSLKTYLAGRPQVENIIVSGDFNFYGSDTEPAWNTMLNGSGVALKDPILSPGHWNSNPGYAPIHTQSTRTTSFGGGATGGMDDRFDIIFVSPDLMNYKNDARYITGTYRAIGQDALHFNSALIDPPTNTSQPWNVITALYHMSDHLPVYMEIEVRKEAASMDELNQQQACDYYYDQENKMLRLKSVVSSPSVYFLYSLSGEKVMEFESDQEQLNLSHLESGTYILSKEGTETLKLVVD
jgi:endonuclease/exonuclease/phosphatase family metal-dependent hydrolase